MQVFVLWILVVQLWTAFSMPYRVPLQGREGGKRTVVILDKMMDASKYSQFIDDLKARGHSPTFFSADDQSFTFKLYGETLYDNLIFLAPAASGIGSLSTGDIVQFFEDGGNIILGVDERASTFVRQLSEAAGVILHPTDSIVVDHQQFANFPGRYV